MIEQQEMVGIEKRDLVETVASLRSSGYRLVQICCTTVADHYEMNYSFDKDRQFRNLRFTVRPGEAVPSIGLIYGNAFLYENEIHDLFGIQIEHMVIDYQGTLYQTRIPAPFSVQVSQPQEGVGSAAAAGDETPKEEHNG
ncbi:MAG: NADH-quinone oxidoreductase subunit C [Candidatus Hydrogenedentota bacterium]|nr:MAG: NADH-quinone oxidoreductase subunit C [Candidatus Hydrogenedentota bacterium]